MIKAALDLTDHAPDPDLDERDLEQTYKRMYRSLVDLRAIGLKNDPDKETPPANFHFTWSHLLLHGKDHEAIEGYRESAKGQYVLRSFPLHRLLYPIRHESYIVLVKANQKLAENKLLELEDEYSTNPIINANCEDIKVKSGKVFSVDVRDHNNEIINVRIEAYGKGAAIRGLSNLDRRPNIVIIDDPQDEEDANSETILENDWNWFLSDIKFLSKSCRIFLIGNNMGEKCIIEMVRKHAKELGFNFRRVPVMNKDNVPLWPERNTTAEILKEREAYRSIGKLDIWLREKMCLSVDEETKVFKKGWRRYYAAGNKRNIQADSSIYITLDPASSKERNACYRAFVVNAVSPENLWYLLDVPFGFWDSVQLIDKLFEIVEKYRPIQVGIEKGLYQQVIEPFIDKEMVRRNIYFEIVPLEHAKEGSKLERIKILAPRFKTGTILFPDNTETDPWVTEMETEMEGVTKDKIKSLRIDLVDALAMQTQIATPPVRLSSTQSQQTPEEEKKNIPGMEPKTALATQRHFHPSQLPRQSVD